MQLLYRMLFWNNWQNNIFFKYFDPYMSMMEHSSVYQFFEINKWNQNELYIMYLQIGFLPILLKYLLLSGRFYNFSSSNDQEVFDIISLVMSISQTILEILGLRPTLRQTTSHHRRFGFYVVTAAQFAFWIFLWLSNLYTHVTIVSVCYLWLGESIIF